MQGHGVKVSNQERQRSRKIFKRGPEHQIQSVIEAEPEHGGERGQRETGWLLALLPGQTSPGLLHTSLARMRSESTDRSLSPLETGGEGEGIGLDPQPLQIKLKRKSAFPKSGGMQSQHPPASGHRTHWCLSVELILLGKSLLRCHLTYSRLTPPHPTHWLLSIPFPCRVVLCFIFFPS